MATKVPNDLLMTDAEVRTFLGVSRTTLWRLRKKHGLPFSRIGKSYRYRRSEVLDWLKTQSSEGSIAQLDLFKRR